MFNTTSMSGTGWIVVIITLVFRYFEIDFSDNQIIEFVAAAATVVGFILAAWGQFRRTDLNLGLFRVE